MMKSMPYTLTPDAPGSSSTPAERRNPCPDSRCPTSISAALAAVDALVILGDGVSKEELRREIGNSKPYGGINLAINRGHIDERDGKGPKGGNAKLCYITAAGRVVHDRRVRIEK